MKLGQLSTTEFNCAVFTTSSCQECPDYYYNLPLYEETIVPNGQPFNDWNSCATSSSSSLADWYLDVFLKPEGDNWAYIQTEDCGSPLPQLPITIYTTGGYATGPNGTKVVNNNQSECSYGQGECCWVERGQINSYDGSESLFTVTGIPLSSGYSFSSLEVQALDSCSRLVYSAHTYTKDQPAGPWSASLLLDFNKQEEPDPTLLMHMDGNFLDSSPNRFQVSALGNPQTDTTTGVFGGSCGYFDGPSSGSRLQIDNFPEIGTGDFSIEFWIYFVEYDDGEDSTHIIGQYESGIGVDWAIGVHSTGKLRFHGPEFDVLSSNSIQYNTWKHVAVTRSSGVLRIFIDGIVEYSGNIFDHITSLIPLTLGGDYSGSNCMKGYIDELRVVKGTARYIDSFEPPQFPFISDPHSSNVVFLFHANEPEGNFIDSSLDHSDLTISGNVIASTNPVKFGRSSVHFQGEGYIEKQSSYSGLGVDDFTIEFWLNMSSSSIGNYQTIASEYSSEPWPASWYPSWFIDWNPYSMSIGFTSTNSYYWYGLYQAFGAANIQPDVWYHVAIVRSSGSVKIFVDGIDTTYYSYTNPYAIPKGEFISLGSKLEYGTNRYYFDGYLDEFRMTKGFCRYTNEFEPPVHPFPGPESSPIIDKGTNGVYVKSNGGAIISNAKSKFGGGSGYFDGKTALIGIPYGEWCTFGSGDFTIEAWIYRTKSGRQHIFGRHLYGLAAEYVLLINEHDELAFFENSTGSAVFHSSGMVVPANQWVHIAAVRDSGLMRLFVDGQGFSFSLPGSLDNPSGFTNEQATIGGPANKTGWMFRGYIDELRITKDVARYAYNFTPNTEPFPSTINDDPDFSDVQLLLHMDGHEGSVTFVNSAENGPDLSPETTARRTALQGRFGESCYFDGEGDHLSILNNSGQIGSGDFTVEFWIRPVSLSNNTTFAGTFSGQDGQWQILMNSGDICWFDKTGFVASAAGPSLNEWTHYAFVRYNGIIKIYKNGSALDSAPNSENYQNTGELWIGHSPEAIADRRFNGYMDDFRIVKGAAVYNSNFAVPSQPLVSFSQGTNDPNPLEGRQQSDAPTITVKYSDVYPGFPFVNGFPWCDNELQLSSSSSSSGDTSSSSSSSLMQFSCIRYSEFNPQIHRIISGPFESKESCEYGGTTAPLNPFCIQIAKYSVEIHQICAGPYFSQDQCGTLCTTGSSSSAQPPCTPRVVVITLPDGTPAYYLECVSSSSSSLYEEGSSSSTNNSSSSSKCVLGNAPQTEPILCDDGTQIGNTYYFPNLAECTWVPQDSITGLCPSSSSSLLCEGYTRYCLYSNFSLSFSAFNQIEKPPPCEDERLYCLDTGCEKICHDNNPPSPSLPSPVASCDPNCCGYGTCVRDCKEETYGNCLPCGSSNNPPTPAGDWFLFNNGLSQYLNQYCKIYCWNCDETTKVCNQVEVRKWEAGYTNQTTCESLDYYSDPVSCSQHCGCCCIDGYPDTSQGTQDACISAGGTWEAGSPCSSNPCGGCLCPSITINPPKDLLITMSGKFGLNCDYGPSICIPISSAQCGGGVCCKPDGECSTVENSKAKCEAVGGTWKEVNDCSSNPCSCGSGGCPPLDGCMLRLRRTYNNGYTDIYSEYPAPGSYVQNPPSFTGGGCVVSMYASDQSGGDFICIGADGSNAGTINMQINPDGCLECENAGGNCYDPDDIQVWATITASQDCAPQLGQMYSPIVVSNVSGGTINTSLNNLTPLGPLAGWTIELDCASSQSSNNNTGQTSRKFYIETDLDLDVCVGSTTNFCGSLKVFFDVSGDCDCDTGQGCDLTVSSWESDCGEVANVTFSVEYQSYNCMSDGCKGLCDDSGEYSTLPECEAECCPTWWCSYSGPQSTGQYSKTGPCEDDVRAVCKYTYDCYSGGCQGYWSEYYYGQFDNYEDCDAACLPRKQCAQWPSNGCLDIGKALTGDTNCDNCVVVAYGCDPGQGCYPIYGNPSDFTMGPDQFPPDSNGGPSICEQHCLDIEQCTRTGCEPYMKGIDPDPECTSSNCVVLGYKCNSSTSSEGEPTCSPVYGYPGEQIPPWEFLELFPDEISCNQACVERFECGQNPYNGTQGCFSIGISTDTSKLEDCTDCKERYECNSSGCDSIGFALSGDTKDDCMAICPTKCVQETFGVSVPGYGAHCGQTAYGTRTISVPSGVSLPVNVTINGGVDDDFMVDGAALYGNCRGAGPVSHTFVLNQTSFQIAALDNYGVYAGYDVTICFDPVTGACCLSDGTCLVTEESECAGTWQGAETSCFPNPCPQPTGACCASDGTCSITTEQDCSGTWQGADTVCDPNPCPQSTGACCASDGTCSITTEQDCSGTWQGADTVCDPNPCPQSTACCLSNGTCQDDFSGTMAVGWQNGSLVMQSTTCSDCWQFMCSPAPGIMYATNSCGPDCIYCTGGGDGYGPWGPCGTAHPGNSCSNSPCSQPTGACCASDGTCSITEELGCNGTWQGVDTVCDPNPCTQPTGACCASDGTCSITTEQDCSGTWQGAGAVCSPNPCSIPCLGACVYSGILYACYDFVNGQLTEVTCPPCGDDCSPGGAVAGGVIYECVPMTSETECTDIGGTWYGSGSYATECYWSSCQGMAYWRGACPNGLATPEEDPNYNPDCYPPSTGACCALDGTCSITTENDCISTSGSWQGSSTSCDPNTCPQPTGACCAPDGTCSITTQQNCPGTWKGANTQCNTDSCVTYCCSDGNVDTLPGGNDYIVPCDPMTPDQNCLDAGNSFSDCCMQAGCDGGGGGVPFCANYATACEFCQSTGGTCVNANSQQEAQNQCGG